MTPMESLQQIAEAWIREQRAKISWPPHVPQWRALRWPWNDYTSQGKKIKEEYARRKRQLHDLCLAVKADSVADLRDILCCMVLSECVYKRPASEVVRAVNKFKADFGGQIISLERVQPSSDHVLHRYLLAEAGDTLFASFIGTKQYKDIMADANILQGAIFHEDVEDIDGIEGAESDVVEMEKGILNNFWKTLGGKPKQISRKTKPAAHRGFLARAKGIPALELYRLAQKKKRTLVLCGHSLGGAVAVLATLAILRVIASSPLKGSEKVKVKCITFSQPPVGNAALRDYVNGKGWQHYFKTYCIPEDLVPRILSPAYFHHYNAQPLSLLADVETSNLSMSKGEGVNEKSRVGEKLKENEGERLVLGLGPLQGSFWRISKLVHLEGIRRQFNKFRGKQVDAVDKPSANSNEFLSTAEDGPRSLEIQEGSCSISLKPLPDEDKRPPDVATPENLEGARGVDNRTWHKMPYLFSYVPFGQLYILENSSVESLSGAEYSKLTSVRSVIAELKEKFQSHSMKSYRSRFQRIYDLCMNENVSSFLGVDNFPHLQQWLGLSVASAVELGHIVESPIIHAATSIVPLSWSGIPGVKNSEPLKVDIVGFGLHLCTMVQAQVNGKWCSTAVESFPSDPNDLSTYGLLPGLQKIRVLVGPPLRRPPKNQIATDLVMLDYASIESSTIKLNRVPIAGDIQEGEFIRPEGLNNVTVYCTSDFSNVSKEVHVRTRRVRLIGLEGAGKTSLFEAILGRDTLTTATNIENLRVQDDDPREGIAGGLSYSDSAGLNLQELYTEASRFKNELWMGIRDLSKKIDLIVLVHNLSHKVPSYNYSDRSQQQPALSLLLNEAKVLGIPWVLAITNKFSVSAHQQKAAVDAVLQAYKASLESAGLMNCCPYVMPSAAGGPTSLGVAAVNSDGSNGAERLIRAPINFVRWPFLKKATILPVEGVTEFCDVIYHVLRSHEEASLQELSRDRLLLELARERTKARDARHDSEIKSSPLSSATVGASLGAGLGLILAIVMGAASALRKP